MHKVFQNEIFWKDLSGNICHCKNFCLALHPSLIQQITPFSKQPYFNHDTDSYKT